MRLARCLVVVALASCGDSSPPPAQPRQPVAPTAEPAPSPAQPEPDVAAPDPARGRALYQQKGCVQCHTIDGTARVGPSWKGIWDTDVVTEDGRTVHVDAAYIHKSIVTPQADVVRGFPPVMPTFAGSISDAGVADITALIQSLK